MQTWLLKRKVNQWMDQQVLKGYQSINPHQFLMEMNNVESLTEKEVWDYFISLAGEGQIVILAGVSCHHEPGSEISPLVLYQKESEMKDGVRMIDTQEVFGKSLICPSCGKKTEVNASSTWIAFSPTDEYKAVIEMEQKAKMNVY